MVKQERRRRVTWPGRTILVGVLLVALFFILPALLLPREADPAATPEPAEPTATLPVLEPPSVEPATGWDGEQTLRLLKADGSVEELTMGEYLWGVVSAEMPASFHIEALKAQTVAARTYCLYQRAGGGDKHPGADVCADYTCCQAYLTLDQAAAGWGDNARLYADKITQAVEDTDGLVCLYDGAPIDAVFFSSTAGRTNDAVTVWGTDVPYLTAVDSPEGEEVPGWHTEVVFAPAEFFARFRLSDPNGEFGDDPATWITDIETDETGMVTALTVGGKTITGGQARSIFGLRSARFTVSATGSEVRFQVTGYGHGVGMSQYGANALAGEGKSFREILEWYYTGAEVAAAP